MFYEVQYKYQITIDITREKKNLVVAKNATTENSNLQKMQITNLKSQIVISKYKDKLEVAIWHLKLEIFKGG